MTVIVAVSHALGFSLAAGVNLYATVAMLGLISRFGGVVLPERFDAFNDDRVITLALVLYAVEFAADKVPWLDSAWDALHTAIRPLGGAIIAAFSFGDVAPTTEVLLALLGGAVATGSHLTKASTRAVVNMSPEPVSNWFVSIAEDLFVVGLGVLTIQYPGAALVFVSALLVFVVCSIGAISRLAWQWIGRFWHRSVDRS
mgnify:CR=1 FL=1